MTPSEKAREFINSPEVIENLDQITRIWLEQHIIALLEQEKFTDLAELKGFKVEVIKNSLVKNGKGLMLLSYDDYEKYLKEVQDETTRN